MDMDAYREAFDIHGEEVHCQTCGVVMDSLSVEHYVEDECDCPECSSTHQFPQCDRCYWSDYYANRDDDDYEMYDDEEN